MDRGAIMLDYKFSKTISKEEFDNFSQNHKKGSFFQTSNWAEVKDNWQPFYTGVFFGGYQLLQLDYKRLFQSANIKRLGF